MTSDKKKRKTNKIAKKKVKRVVYKKITITLPEETVEKLEKLAKSDNWSKSNMVWRLIEKSKIR